MANVPISNLTTTWNNVSTTFTGIKLNVTDTASAAGSLLMDLQVGAVSRFKVTKDGFLTLKGNLAEISIGYTGETNILIQQGGFINSNVGSIAWSSSGTGVSGGNRDLSLFRDAANTLAQRNGVNAQTHRIYGTYTDVSNYRRLTKTMSIGGVAEIKPEGAGTGASGNVLHISGLPTSNPGPGILYSNLGIVTVGT